MRFSIGKHRFLAVVSTCLFTAAMLLASLASTVGLANDGITSNAIIHRAGLTIDWFTHTGAGASGKLADWYINVDENKSTTFFTIEAGTYRESFSQNTLNPFGKPYGVDGALEYAAIRKEILLAEFANDGIQDVEVKIDQYTLPETTVYGLTSAGTVRAIDGDTGETKWSVEIGNPRSPSIGISANDKYVAAINGSNLYCLEAATGKQLWTAQCRYAVGASPTVADDRIYVPLINGRLESFGIAENGTDSSSYVSKGRGTARPLVTEKTVSWSTDRGDLNVASRFENNKGVAYQLRCDDSIVCDSAFKQGMFFVTSLDGFVYALDEDRGSIIWQVSTGHSISQSPIALGNFIFVINDNHEMYKLDAKKGFDAPGWEVPLKDVDRFVGASKNNMYILDRFGKMKILSQESGTTINSVNFGSVQSVLPNVKNDRLYIVSDRGLIQCIREIGSPIPHFHSNEFVALEIDPQTGAPKAGGADPDDPFRTLDANDNPFGGNDKPAAPVVPGSGDDPFAGVDTPPAADPVPETKPQPAADPAADPAPGTNPLSDDDDPFN